MIVIIGKHNTDVLSTAVNDLVMIVYYDPCYTHRSSRSKEGFRQKCWYRSGGTCCSHSEWTISANVPIPAHSIVSYIGPEQSRALPMMHALNWRKVKKSTWEYWKVVPHVTNAFVALTVYIYTDVPAAILRSIWHNWTCSQTTVMFQDNACSHGNKGPRICTPTQDEIP